MKTTADKIALACVQLEKRVDRYIQDWALESGLETYSECFYVTRMSREDAVYEGMRVRYRMLVKEHRRNLVEVRQMREEDARLEAAIAEGGFTEEYPF